MTSDNDQTPAPFKPSPCPICAKMSVVAHHPFCSQRCTQVDLGRWLGGRYAIPAAPDDPDTGPGGDGGDAN